MVFRRKDIANCHPWRSQFELDTIANMSELSDKKANQETQKVSTEHLEKSLMELYGPMIGGSTLRKVLGYPTAAALRRAHERGLLSVPVFEIPSRRGKFALTQDVAVWLVECRSETQSKNVSSPS